MRHDGKQQRKYDVVRNEAGKREERVPGLKFSPADISEARFARTHEPPDRTKRERFRKQNIEKLSDHRIIEPVSCDHTIPATGFRVDNEKYARSELCDVVDNNGQDYCRPGTPRYLPHSRNWLQLLPSRYIGCSFVVYRRTRRIV